MRYLHIILFLCLPLLGVAQQSWNVRLLCNWNDTTGITLNGGGARYNDTWGFVMKGKEYGVLGSTEGTHIIDVDQCSQVAFYPGRVRGNDIVHRAYSSYQHYLYAVAGEGQSSLQIFDLNYLPDSLHLVYESNYTDLMVANSIFIDTAKATLYVCSPIGLSSGNDDLRVYSLANPENPTLLVKYNMYDQVHTVYVRNDTAYCSSSSYGYVIVDFSTHGSFRVLGTRHLYPYQGYNHSSWINSKNMGVMADETFGLPIKVIDVKDPTQIRILGTFAPRNGQDCIPHNTYVTGDNVFLSYYMDGLQMYNISNPDSPKRIGYYDTYPGPDMQGFAGAWGCYPFLPSGRILVSDMQTGLYVFNVDSALQEGAKLAVPTLALIDDKVSIYPNPVTDKFKVLLPNTVNGPVQGIVYDISGRKIIAQSFLTSKKSNQSIELTLPAYCPPGIYLLKVVTGGNVYTGTFSKS